MHSDHARRLLSAALAATVLFVIPAQAAGRRRAVTHPTAGALLSAEAITGTITDDVTGQPVAAVKVNVGNRTDTTDAAGKFKVKNVSGYGRIVVEAARSGYTTKTVGITTGGDQVVNLTLHALPTVHVRKPSGAAYDVDLDSSEFGYPAVFSGYNSATNEQFCKPNGTQVTIDRSEIRRITGPATMVHFATCCTTHDVLKVNAELKTGEVTDLYFVDTCSGIPSIEFIARDHVTGKIVATPFTDIAEIVFP